MAKIVLVGGIYPLPQTKIHDEFINGSGSVWSYQATGNAGQTGKVEGSSDGVMWSDIVTFTIDTNAQVLSAVKPHTWLYLKISGDAVVKYNRGAA